MNAVLPLVVLVPLLGAASAVVVPRAGAVVSSLCGGALLGVAVWLGTHTAAGEPLVHRAGLWGAPVGIDLRADGVAALLLGVSALVGLCVSAYAAAYLRPGEGPGDDGFRFFWPLWLLAWAALNGIFVATDLFNLYVCLELLSLSAVALVALESSHRAVVAAMRYLLVSLAGSLAFLTGVAFVYAGAGTLSLELLSAGELAPHAERAALALMTAGLIAKAALVPLHFWLPPAHAVAPAPASAVLSALVVKAAFVIVVRLWTGPFAAALPGGGATLVGVLGAVAVLWGSLLALRQVRVKMIIACSTVAQVGYLFLMIPLLHDAPADAWAGGMMHLAAHALAKAAMFLAAGSMIRALGDDDLETLAGVGQKLPVTFATFGIAGLNLAGMPPSGGFLGKWLLLSAAMSSGQWWWAVVIAAGSLLAAAYVLLVLKAAFLQPGARALQRQPPRRMAGAALALALASLLLGMWALPPTTLLSVSLPAALR